jgi:hypothetical protein
VARMHLHRWMFLMLLLAAAPLHAGGPLEPRFSFDERSRDALVIVEVAPQKIFDHWYLELAEFSLESKTFTGSIYKGGSLLQRIDSAGDSPRYFAGVVKGGGTHIVYQLGTQVKWSACFDKSARVFKFEPGKVYFLGAVDPNEGLLRIARELPKSARTPYWVYGLQISYIAPAQQAGWEQEVAAFISGNFPKVKAPLLAAEGVEVSFNPGKAPRGNPVCRANY